MASLFECVQSCNLTVDATIAEACLEGCYTQHTSVESTLAAGIPSWAAILIATLLIPLSGLFAGLTLGLLSLDLVSLKIIEQAGEAKERAYARRIIPVRRHGNRLLCTLLLGNTIINSAISIMLSDLTSGPVGLLVSTIVILIAGEIVPQAICSRHGLKIGAQSIEVVKAFMLLLLPITWPIGKVLDWALGRDIGNVYSQEELKRLIDIHVTDPDASAESGLTPADHKLLMGAFSYKDKRVRDVMTDSDKCFMVDKSLRLDFEVMLEVYKSGFTRIPVYDGSRDNIVGILYSKDLILVDPEDEIEIGAVLSLRGRNVARIFDHEKLDKVLEKFMASNNHMLIAHSGDDCVEERCVEGCSVSGLITLEDVLEELIQAEIVDETDNYEDMNLRVPRRLTKCSSLNHLIPLYEQRFKGDSHKLSAPEVDAVAAFLAVNVPEFVKLARNEATLKGLIRHAELLVIEPSSSHDTLTPASSIASSSPEYGAQQLNRAMSWGSADKSSVPLYIRGTASPYFTLVLQGRVMIRACREDFTLELGAWSAMGHSALTQELYVPDFDALGVPPGRVLRIHRAAYVTACEACRVEKLLGSHALRQHMRSSSATDLGGVNLVLGGDRLIAAPRASFTAFDGVGAGVPPTVVREPGAAPSITRRLSGQIEDAVVSGGGGSLLMEAATRPVGFMSKIFGGPKQSAAEPDEESLLE